MANSTTIITDLKSVLTNGPQGTTAAKSIAAAGPIMDYTGNLNILLLKMEEASVLIKAIIADTDASGDATNLALLQGVQNDLT